MKRISLLFAIVFFFTHLAYAQVPQGIPYQAAARNASGQALVNTAVKVRFSILDSVATGTLVYKETHSTTTNSVGLFNVNVGMGTPVTGTFSSINWGKNAKFMQMELDITGTGSNYVNMGTQQMLSVPYALYAGSAGSVQSTLSQVGQHFVIFDSAGTYTWQVPIGVNSITVEAIGGGGGGGAGHNSTSGGSGGGGGAGNYKKSFFKVSSGTIIQCIVGAGGTGGKTFSASGASGGNTQFGQYLIVSGGGGGGGGLTTGSSVSSYGTGGVSVGLNGNGSLGVNTNWNDWRAGGSGGGVGLLNISGGSGAYVDLFYPYNMHPANQGESNGAGGGGGGASWTFPINMWQGANGKDGLVIIYY